MQFFKIDWEVVTDYVREILNVRYGIDTFCRYEIENDIVSIYAGGACIIAEDIGSFYDVDMYEFADYIIELIEDFDKGEIK